MHNPMIIPLIGLLDSRVSLSCEHILWIRPHTKLNPRTALTPAFLAHNPNLRGAVP